MTEYMPRSSWTSAPRGGAQLTGTQLVGIAWHWPGTGQNVIGVESESATANRLRGYRNFHVNTRGWADIGYNFAIDQAGRVWDLRGLGRVGAHCASPSNPDANHEWLGVLLILGDQERPSDRMVRACQDFVHDVFLPRWPGRTRDTGHGRAPGVPGAQTSCPGPFAAELIVDGELTEQPMEDDMTPQQAAMLADIHDTLTTLIAPNTWMTARWSDMPDEGYSPRTYLRAAYGHARYSAEGSISNGEQIAKLLAGQQAIMAAQGIEVDEAELARQIAAVLVPAVVAELSDVAEQDIEAAMERVLRRVLGTLDA